MDPNRFSRAANRASRLPAPYCPSPEEVAPRFPGQSPSFSPGFSKSLSFSLGSFSLGSFSQVSLISLKFSLNSLLSFSLNSLRSLNSFLSPLSSKMSLISLPRSLSLMQVTDRSAVKVEPEAPMFVTATQVFVPAYDLELGVDALLKVVLFELPG